MLNIFKLSFAIKYTYRVNGILYTLKQLPLLKDALPAKLYGLKGLKILAYVLAGIWELIAAFGGKYLYFALMLFGGLSLYQTVAPGAAFLHILFFLSLIGAYMNTYMFNPSKDKYYAVILMRMDAKKSTLVSYGYELLKVLLAFGACGLFFGLRVGLPLWQCLLIPFFVLGNKLSVSAWQLRKYRKTGVFTSENKLEKWQWLLTGALLLVAYIPPLAGYAVPALFLSVLMLLSVLGGLLSIREILSFRDYRALCQQILPAHMEAMRSMAGAQKKLAAKQIEAGKAATSEKRGMEYLNELFVKRHRKILWKSSQHISALVGALLAIAVLLAFAYPELRRFFSHALVKRFSWMALIMYTLNRGSDFTRALFMNCDHSLLTYSFYKTPQSILQLFRIRLREIIKVNLLPAAVIAVGVDALLFVSGEAVEPIYYLTLPLAVISMSVFFSVHYLTLYYLLQPYNMGTKMKSASYALIGWLTYALCYVFVMTEIGTLAFALLCIPFCVVYSVVACLLAFKLAPRTFRIRA